ncbi:MAG: HAD family hydrolase [Candidatus Norongarragalinales archaeon]
MKKTRKFKVVSFDLDDTLVDRSFDYAVWFNEIPRLYAAKHGISFKKALRECRRAYDSVGSYRIEWYSIDYWLKRFGLRGEKNRILRDFAHLAEKPFPDAAPALRSLKRRGYCLIVVSNASPCFLRVKLEASGLKRFFHRCFSVTGEFRTVLKSKRVYSVLCRKLRCLPSEIVHVGDYRDFDFDQPRAAGVTAFLLNRNGEHKPLNEKESFFIVRDLKEFEKRLLELESKK